MQDLAPCHRLMMSQSVSTQGGCGLWFPVGMGSLGGRRNEPSCLCAAWQVDVLSPLSLPCCLTALSVLGLGLMVPPGAPGFRGRYIPQSWTGWHSPDAAQGQCKDPAVCLALPRKVKISSKSSFPPHSTTVKEDKPCECVASGNSPSRAPQPHAIRGTRYRLVLPFS